MSLTSLPQRKGLTSSQISAVQEILEGFVLMERHGISREGCASLGDIRMRLRLHYNRQMGQGRSPEAAQQVLSSLKQEDEVKRMELRNIFQESLKCLEKLDQYVINHMISEGTVANLHTDLEAHIENLSSNECPILVAGETSAGKSSLLNLLLGQEILPHRLLSCTSVICRLRYGPKMLCRANHVDGRVEEVLLKKDNPVEQLSRFIFKDGRRDVDPPYKSIDVFLPLDLLKTGIYIIDSPGFGENAVMDKLLLDYIANNQIFAFIYVIKSDNAGGVQEDRLQRILKHIVDKQKGDAVGSFDPRAALFVCNRWDLIPDVEKEVVFQDTLRKLSRSWPNLDKSQMFCMSTTKSWRTRQAGYVADDFANFLDGLERLVPVGLQRKIQLSYKFLEHILSSAKRHVSGYLAKTRISAKEMHLRQRATEMRLHKVEQESELVMKKLEKQLDKHVRTISARLGDYLQTGEARERMGQWTMDQLPRVSIDDVWADVEAELDCLIENNLAEVIREWDAKYCMFAEVQKDLFNTFKHEFLIMDSQLSTIENYIQSDELSLSSRSEDDTMRHFSITEANLSDNSDKALWHFNIDTLERVALGVAAPTFVPMAVGMMIGAPVLLLWDFKKWRRRSIAQKNLILYLENPVAYVTKRSLQTIDKVADIEIVSEYVFTQLDSAREYIDAMRSSIPKLIENNRTLIDAIVKDKRTSEELESLYSGFEKSIPVHQERLARFANIHLRQYDLNAKDVEVDSEPAGGFQTSQPTRAIWTEMRAGKLHTGSRLQTVTVKKYTQFVSSLQLIAEEIHYRRVKHPHIAQLMGSFEARRGVPGFVFEAGLVRARRELFGFKQLTKKSKDKRILLERSLRFLEEVSMALEYLHAKGLVHMELSLDTVMLVTGQNRAKLTNLGESRPATLPRSLDVKADAYVYLPPEVLRGGLYRCRSDIYSLGLMAWELWNQELAFKRQRSSRLDHFIQTLRPSLLRGSNSNPFEPLIMHAVHTTPAHRSNSTDWVNCLRNFDLSKLNEDDPDETGGFPDLVTTPIKKK